jgi:hypothetical protein
VSPATSGSTPPPRPRTPCARAAEARAANPNGRRHVDGGGAVRLLPAVLRGGAAALPRGGCHGHGRGGAQRGAAAAAHEARHRGGRHVRAAARGEAHTALLPRQRRRPRPDVRALRRARLPPQRQHHGVRPSLLLPQDRIEILSLLLATCYCAVCDALKLPELVNGV